LVACAGIDARTQLLPDDLTLPLMWTGLLLSLVPVFVAPSDAILGACLGYVSLWSVFKLYQLWRGVDGMGFGDFKILAAAGAWLGWQKLLLIVLLASVTGFLFAIVRILRKEMESQSPMAFGPFLAAAAWVALVYGDAITRWYLALAEPRF
jgi:leader peptidase (prepilin peptidase) / N-methyltransferase